ncbi:Phosphatidate phosphatase LPIN2 [Thelohanellus kitauei]|uniref:Phosphatidate phosphatase LPIN2 n=1 Tax=Thelohanellus kitauei TaxID=669202 RepID=A0A0C2J247_THEKT|nr:Phosphatidate phosphatase LPIN2 [Thelohanellus kitauei]
MHVIGGLVSNFANLYQDINPSKLSGAIDVVVIRQPDGTLKSSPFYVKFGVLDIIKAGNQEVDIYVNDKLIELHMELGKSGHANFINGSGPCNCSSCRLSAPVCKSLDSRKNAPGEKAETADKQFKRSLGISNSNPVLSDSEIYVRESKFIRHVHNDYLYREELPSGSRDFSKSTELNLLPHPAFSEYRIKITVFRWNCRYVAILSIVVENLVIFILTDKFDDLIVPFNQFVSNPPYYNWAIAGPTIVSYVAYNSFLPNETLLKLKRQHFPKKDLSEEESGQKVCSDPNQIFTSIDSENSLGLESSKKPCGSDSNIDVVMPSDHVQTASIQNPVMHVEPKEDTPAEHLICTKLTPIPETTQVPNDPTASQLSLNTETSYASITGSNTDLATTALQATIAQAEPNPSAVSPDSVLPPVGHTPSCSSIEPNSRELPGIQDSRHVPQTPDLVYEDCQHKPKTLSSESIEKLGLRDGENSVTFSITTRYQAKIFLWNYTDRIIISDVDGTITRSDILGLMLPIIGKDWTQGGVSKLFTSIHNNGYKIIYLSARTIGISNQTRRYLENILLDTHKLPPGPILLSPSSLIEALHREVILKKPEIFKINCLQNIVSLFPPDTYPLVSGFGNRISDYRAYLAVGIPQSKIFIINDKGQIRQKYSDSYLAS